MTTTPYIHPEFDQTIFAAAQTALKGPFKPTLLGFYIQRELGIKSTSTALGHAYSLLKLWTSDGRAARVKAGLYIISECKP